MVGSGFKNFELHLGQVTLTPSYLQAGVILVLIFFLLIIFAQVRRHVIVYSFRGVGFGMLFGFLLALIVEGFFLIAGRTVLTEVLGIKNAPAPLQSLVDAGNSKLLNVVGNCSPK